MNKSHVKGTIQDVKGRVKEDVGHALGNEKMEGEGIIDQVTGKAKKAFGDVKDKIKEVVDKNLHRAS